MGASARPHRLNTIERKGLRLSSLLGSFHELGGVMCQQFGGGGDESILSIFSIYELSDKISMDNVRHIDFSRGRS